MFRIEIVILPSTSPYESFILCLPKRLLRTKDISILQKGKSTVHKTILNFSNVKSHEARVMADFMT
jgi:hypothetical protein